MVKKKETVSIDIKSHKLVPSHKRLTDAEKIKLLKGLNISPLQLPSIKMKDPMIKLIGAKLGDIIKITRKESTGTYDYYRRVTE